MPFFSGAGRQVPAATVLRTPPRSLLHGGAGLHRQGRTRGAKGQTKAGTVQQAGRTRRIGKGSGICGGQLELLGSSMVLYARPEAPV